MGDKKGLYIVFHGFADYSGITQKIHSQVKALNGCGVATQLCYQEVAPNGESLIKVDQEIIHSFGIGMKSKILKRYDYKSIEKYIVENGISFVYIRHYANANPFLVSFAKRLRKKGISIVLEIPTYPYDHEFKEAGTEDRIKHLIDKAYRNSLGNQLNYICTFTDHPEIYGCKTIRLSNGIDFDRIPVKLTQERQSERIDLIAVGELHYWHGFDRMIQGLSDFYRSNPAKAVYLHIVGKPTTASGEELRALAISLGISEYVIFHGPMSGESLDELFNLCQIAVGSLGRHRSGISIIKPLKNREYAARGIPFFYSETDPDFESQSYVFKVPADETAVQVGAIIQFYESVKMTPGEIRATINPLLSWNSQMRKVVDTCFPEL
ncbi:MAG: glycosyltransferase family 1 protein [Bacteroidales bacterium]